MSRLEKLFSCLFLGLLLGSSARADSLLTPAGESPPLDRTFSSFSPAEKSRFRLHGIRNTMLHPRLWGSLAREKTHNVRIVPIKRFFLRSSEDPSYRLKSLEATFRFSPVDKASILKSPHDFDPIFEVGFASHFLKTSESGFAVRISAFPPVASGIVEYHDGKSSFLVEASPKNVGAYQAHELRIEFQERKVSVVLDKQPFADFSFPEGATATDLRKGMLSLLSSWHPVYISALRIQGSVQKNGEEQVLEESGLIEMGVEK